MRDLDFGVRVAMFGDDADPQQFALIARVAEANGFEVIIGGDHVTSLVTLLTHHEPESGDPRGDVCRVRRRRHTRRAVRVRRALSAPCPAGDAGIHAGCTLGGPVRDWRGGGMFDTGFEVLGAPFEAGAETLLDRAIVGSVDEVVEALGDDVDAGVTRIDSTFHTEDPAPTRANRHRGHAGRLAETSGADNAAVSRYSMMENVY
jgi:hypothetical protein